MGTWHEKKSIQIFAQASASLRLFTPTFYRLRIDLEKRGQKFDFINDFALVKKIETSYSQELSRSAWKIKANFYFAIC